MFPYENGQNFRQDDLFKTEPVTQRFKRCKNCQQRKSLDEFNIDNSTPTGRHRFCKVCLSEIRKAYLAKNPHVKSRNYWRWGITHKGQHRGKHLKDRYGLTLKEFENLLEQQNGRCAVCGDRLQLGTGKFATDHCHKTNIVRGILCNNCNTAEGMMKTLERAQKLVDYMCKNEVLYAAQKNGSSKSD
jgi:hypothetical protein